MSGVATRAPRAARTQSPAPGHRVAIVSVVLLVLVAMAGAACGKKGPPLPPLVRVPIAPAEFSAERRGPAVDLQFVVPAANTDNTRPGNVTHVDVYAVTSHETFTDDQIVKQGAKVASVAVKAPKDPDKTIDEDESVADMEAPEGQGLDQGAVARVSETLAGPALVPVQPKADKRAKHAPVDGHGGPLLPPSPIPLTRTYLAVGVSKSDKKGPPSKRLSVPLVPPPPAPSEVVVNYDEKAITVTWNPVTLVGGIQRPPIDDELPSRLLNINPVTLTYNVYDTTARPNPAKLTQKALDAASFADSRVVWGEERCYTVRAVAGTSDLKVESDAPPPACVTLKDTFPPAAPTNLQSSPAEGVISLIWDANTESDLAGYIVLRGTSADTLQPIVNAPIQESQFRDQVAPGIRFTYAVKAVDRAGNQSPASKTIEEAAR